MSRTVFGIIGSGWRAEFFLRVAAALPERFHVAGVVVRDETKGQAFAAAWGTPTYRTLDALLTATDPAFIVLSVPRVAAPELMRDLAGRHIPVLTETPPAADLDGLHAVWRLVERGARIQVAEQYLFQPLHAARLALVQSGKLGTISYAQLSVAHEYHAISLLRRFLYLGFANATITARNFVTPLVAGPNRQGPPVREQVAASAQVIAQLDFGAKLGIYDFTNDQYFSWIRTLRFLVRGDQGEIADNEVRFLPTFDTPVALTLRRESAGENGNLEGYYLKGILAGTDWVYRNPFAPARLTDDEIAVATCLTKMAEYVAGGAACYPFAEAAQDQYLSLMMREAAAAAITTTTTGSPVTTVTQPWAS